MQSAYIIIRARDLDTDIQGEVSDHVTLDLEGRLKRRIVLTSRQGRDFLVNLPEVPNLNDGDAYQLEDGSKVGVIAADEAVYKITGRDSHHILRLAWHLGNRHLATEIDDGTLYIRADHVIADMVRGLGGKVKAVRRAFQPEGGAYAIGGHGHHHHHGNDHD